jgi:adenylate cyclase
MRTFQELNDAVKSATSSNDAAALMQYADELDALTTSEAEAVAHNARGVVCYLRGNYPEALEHYHRASAIHEELGNRGSVAFVTCVIGIVHQSTGNYPAALEHYHRSLTTYEELGDRGGVAHVIVNIGIVHRSTGNYPEALEHFHRALAMLEELGDRSGVANLNGNIGNVHSDTGNYPAALEHYHRASAMYEELGNRIGVARVTGNIGVVHMNTGNHAASLEHYHRALALHEELGNRSGVAVVTGNLLSTMMRSGEHVDAEALLQTMDALQIDDPDIVVQRELHRASLQQHHGNSDEATATLGAALRIAQEHSIASKQADVHKALRDLALKQSDLAGYVEHNNEYTRISEEINGKEATLKMAMQEKQREMDAKDREHQKHMAVLHSALPKHIADRVARGEVVNDHFDNASVIFLDIVGFTELSSSMSSQEVITLLDTIFSQCDAICEQHNVTKIKTIGDSYMCVSFDSVVNAAHCALAMSRIKFSHEVSHNVSHVVSHAEGILPVSHEVLFRIGIHCGPVTAGAIGTQRMQYDVWGDTVNVASRMESSGEAGRIHVSQAFAENLEEESRINNQESNQEIMQHLIKERGQVDLKGKGMMQTFWLEGST